MRTYAVSSILFRKAEARLNEIKCIQPSTLSSKGQETFIKNYNILAFTISQMKKIDQVFT